MTTFSDDLRWSLEATNTSTAVSFLHAVWPSASWVTTCATTDAAGVDLLGLRDGLPPVRVDVKHRRVSDARRRYFQADDVDGVFDISYVSNHGQRRDGPVKRYNGDSRPCPADYLLYVYPQEEPALALLVNAQKAHAWLCDYYVALRSLTTETTYGDGLTWLTTFVPVPASLLNARAGRGTARLLTLNASGAVMVNFP